MCDLVDLSKMIIKKDDGRYPNISKLNQISEYLKGNRRKRILILGMNPSEYDSTVDDIKSQDGVHLEYVDGINDNDKNKLIENNLINTKYFKALYDLFDKDTVQMSWTVLENCKEKLESLGINVAEKEDKNRALLIFGDLLYYHCTNQKELEDIIMEFEKNNIKVLYETIKKIIETQINMFDPNLILITNSFAAKLVYRVYKEKNDYCEDIIVVKNTKIILSGMVSGGNLDVFSKVRLKNRIKELL